MIKPENINNAPRQSNDSVGTGLLRKMFRHFWVTNLGVPILQYLMGLFGIVISLYILIIAYTNTQERLNDVQQSVDSFQELVDSFRVHVNQKHPVIGPKDKSIKYDTIIIPHKIIEDLNKLGTPGN